MLSKSIFFSVLSLLFLSASCNSNASAAKSSSKVEASYKSVMAVHDEVMPEMGTIHRLRKQLNKKMRAEGSDEAQNKTFRQMVTKLDEADEGMMSWMAEFKIPKDGSEEEKLAYLKEQQQKIDKVSEDMYSAIKEAEEMVKSATE